MIKTNKSFLFATDLDGTLLNHNKILSKGNREELIKLSKNPKFNFLVVTGRSFGELHHILPQLPEEIGDYYVGAANGAYLFEITKNKRIDHKVIPLENEEDIFKHYIKLYLGWGCVSTQLKSFREMHHPNLFKAQHLNKEIVKDRILKINGVLRDDYKDDPSFKKLKKMEERRQLTVYVHTARAPFLEITSYDAKKINIINNVMKLTNIEKDQVIVAGDSDNDIEMINSFKSSFVMRNGTIWERVNQNTATRLESTNEDGFIKEILTYIS